MGFYWNDFNWGCYDCVCCEVFLFFFDIKFDVGCGWLSFFQVIDFDVIREIEDWFYGMVWIEICCSWCDVYLGYVFLDGLVFIGLCYCLNGYVMCFVEDGEKC